MKRNGWSLILIAVLILVAALTVARTPVHLGLDLVGGVRGVFLVRNQNGAVPSAQEMQTARETLERRVNSLGVSEAHVQEKGTDQLIVEIPLSGPVRKLNSDEAMTMLMNVVKPAWLEFVEVPEEITVSPPRRNEKGEEVYYYTRAGQRIPEDQALADRKVIVTGKELLPDASAEFTPQGDFAVSLHFNSDGANKFADYTQAHVGKPFGVVLDGHLITNPVIREPIVDGRGQISGGFPRLQDAQHLATLLNAGALPVKLNPIQTSQIEATLGQHAVASSIKAGFIGLVLVVLFMWAYYRLPGFLATVALGIYALLTFAIFMAIPVTLTLPGIAGFILSVGMAVDANILIFERMKEELRSGRTLRAAVEPGFNRAFSAIVDSNACTLIACGVLGWYGTGPVKGFAVTLAIGVLVSLFTAVVVTRTLLHLLDNTPAFQKPEYFGVNVQWMGKWAQGRNIIGNRRKFYILSLAVIVPGLIFLIIGGLHPGVDFTGGNEWIIQSKQDLTEQKVSAALTGAGIARSRYDLTIGQNLGEQGEKIATIHAKPRILTKDLSDTQHRSVIETLHREGVTDAQTASGDHIDPIIGAELERNAVSAVLLASLLIVIYLSFRFREGGIKDGVKYGVCAIIAMLHDVLVTIGVFAILGKLLQVEIDMNFVTALLTIIGFSVHDTIVIFDRVRENLRLRDRGEEFETTYNKSIVQTAARSINTSFTVILVLIALVLFGAPVIFWFNIALLVGIVSGTYSSIFNASPLVVDWQIFKRRREQAAKAAAAGARSPASASSSLARTPRPTSAGETGRPAPRSSPSIRPRSGPAPSTSPNGGELSQDGATALRDPADETDEETRIRSTAGRARPRNKRRF